MDESKASKQEQDAPDPIEVLLDIRESLGDLAAKGG